MESRAAVFTTRPQDVEVYQAGAWWPGSLLGWRHDTTGDCQVWVRVVIGGVEETAWTDLTTLRLPERSSERHLAMAPALSANEQLKVAAGRMPAPGAADGSATRSLPAVPQASRDAQRSGGRRRAPEPATAEFAVTEAPAAVVPPGRHRAAGLPAIGRHRTADTGIWHTVADDATGRLSASAEAPDMEAAIPSGGGRRRADRSGAPPGLPASPWATRAPAGDQAASSGRRRAPEPEPDLLTRPMRLDDLARQSRKPRLDGFLAKA